MFPCYSRTNSFGGGTTKLTCAECGDSPYLSDDALKAHVASAHVGWLPYKCTYCRQFTSTIEQIKRHCFDRHPDQPAVFKVHSNDENEALEKEILDRSYRYSAERIKHQVQTSIVQDGNSFDQNHRRSFPALSPISITSTPKKHPILNRSLGELSFNTAFHSLPQITLPISSPVGSSLQISESIIDVITIDDEEKIEHEPLPVAVTPNRTTRTAAKKLRIKTTASNSNRRSSRIGCLSVTKRSSKRPTTSELVNEERVVTFRHYSAADAIRCEDCNKSVRRPLQHIVEKHSDTYIYECNKCSFSWKDMRNSDKIKLHFASEHPDAADAKVINAVNKYAKEFTAMSKIFFGSHIHVQSGRHKKRNSNITHTRSLPSESPAASSKFAQKEAEQTALSMSSSSSKKIKRARVQCSFCPETVHDHSTSLRQHIYEHIFQATGNARYLCDVCGFLSVAQIAMTFHLKKHHNIDRKINVAEPDAAELFQSYASKCFPSRAVTK